MNASDDERERYARRVDELVTGDQIFTPAFRWETVTRIDAGERYSWATQVFTDRTGSEYSWRFADHHEMPALRAWQTHGTPAVHIEVLPQRVIVFVGIHAEYYRERNTPVLAEAVALGRGRGWEVADMEGGREPVLTTVASKTKALSLIKRAAKAHAKALGLSVFRPEGGTR